MIEAKLLIGQTLSFVADPFFVSPDEATRFNTSGAVLIQNGKIADLGNRSDLTTRYPKIETLDYSDYLLTAGLIDAHCHYPQTAIIASWGARLIEWLSKFTFPEEQKFNDASYASAVARFFLDTLLANGTTTACSFCTIHPESADALFVEAQKRNMRLAAGKTCMDRNAPPSLCDDVRSSYDASRALIRKWHNSGRLHYVITPRFAPTSTPEQLQALGSLWHEHPECMMQTHLSEQVEEIRWVRQLFPQAKDYLDVYEQAGLLGPGGLYGHAVHLERRERDRLREVGGRLIHCPTSNAFIGSGLFRTHERIAEGQVVGLASDVGGGSSFSMFRVMASAYETSQLTGMPLHPSQLFWLATAGNAIALHMENDVGNLQIGNEADIIAIDLRSTPLIANRHRQANSFWDSLFPTIMMGDDRAIKDVWIAGNKIVELSC